MIRLSYHISHEQFAPSELLSLAQQAEEAGFDAAFSSDHIHPWAPQQGNAGFIWAWLGAALQATRRLSFIGITVPGGWRFHPAIVAQALATLGEMFPGRLPWFALGSGEALNEHVVCGEWPEKAERNARLEESAQIMRALFAGRPARDEAAAHSCTGRADLVAAEATDSAHGRRAERRNRGTAWTLGGRASHQFADARVAA